MSISAFMLDPSWTKVHLSIAVAFCGILTLIALRVKVVRGRKKDIYKPDVMIAETFGLDDCNDIAANISTRDRISASTRVQRRILRASLTLLCIALTVVGFATAIPNYIVLSNLDEGISRDYIGDHVGAIVSYKKALRVYPSLGRTHKLIGVALLKSGRIGSAVPELEAAVRDDKRDAEAPGMLGDAQMLLKHPMEAAAAYWQAIDIKPQDPYRYIAFAGALEMLGRPDNAYAAYAMAIQVDPRNVKAHVKLGALLINTGHLDQGVANLKRAITLAPNDVIAHSTLGTAYGRFKRYTDAIVEFRSAIALDPKYAVAHFNLGVTLEKMNEWQRAQEVFRICTKLAPRNMAEKDAVERSQVEIGKIQARTKRSA